MRYGTSLNQFKIDEATRLRQIRRLRTRAGFADPDWLVGISVCLVLGLLLLPLARRNDWIGWGCAVTSAILILPFVLLVVCGAYQRIKDLLIPSEDETARHRDCEE
jgi:uncharacterized membrane protein YcjF (UPF0283 family)